MQGVDVPKPRRGRPPNLPRRRRIVREALRLFSAHGFGGCTMREIAEACEMSDSLLHRYYPHKETLLDATVTNVIERLHGAGEALCTLTNQPRTLREQLLVFGRFYLEHVDDMTDWYACRFGALPLSDAQRRAVNDAEEHLYQTIASTLAPRLHARDPYVAVRVLTGALRSLVLMQNRTAFEPASEQLRATFLRETVDMLMFGIGPAETTIARAS